MEKLPVEILKDKIKENYEKYLSAKIGTEPPTRYNFWCSDLRVECPRYMVYSVLNWKDRALHDTGLQARFEIGNLSEKYVKRILDEMGLEVILQQKRVTVPNKEGETIASGRIDGDIKINKELITCELKLTVSYKFDKMNTVEDLLKDTYGKLQVRQLMTYLYGNNKETGMLIYHNGYGQIKPIIVYLDYGLMEWVVSELEKDWEYVKKKEYPDRMNYNAKICSKCAFSHICLPDMEAETEGMIDDEELETQIDRHQELSPVYSEYTKLNSVINDKVMGRSFIIGKHQVSGAWINKSKYDVPKEIKNQYKLPDSKFWKKSIKKLGG